MTDYDALEKLAKEAVGGEEWGTRETDALMSAIRDLRAERDAEKLKRQQAEHERDCILEDLAVMGKERDGLIGLLREVRDAYMKDTRPFKLFGKAWNLRGCVDAALAAQGQV